MLAMRASLRLRSGIAASSRWLFRPRFGFAVTSQSIHAGNASLARHRRGIAASSRCQCRLRFGFAVALQRLHAGNAGLASTLQWCNSVFMLVTQTSLRLLSGLVVFPRWQCRLRFSNAERIHAGNASLASVSQWHRSVSTLSMKASLWLRSGIAASSRT